MVFEQQPLARPMPAEEPRDAPTHLDLRAAQLWAALDRCESLLEQNAAREADASRIDQLRSELKQISAELDQIKNSNLWRIGSRIHLITGRLPAPIRRQLRRVAKAAYWALTPHKIAARVRYRRAIGAQATAVAIAAEPAESRQPALDLRTCFCFTPSFPGTRQVGQYSLAVEPQRYIYIPPRRPERLRLEIDALTSVTQFAIVVPIYNPPLDVFHSMIASVQAQWYPYWELILVDDCSTSLDVVEAVKAKAGVDDRIQIVSLSENQGISDATNAGIQQARGNYVVFLDHDDELTPDCLFELAQAIDRDNPDYLYSDEDKITRSGICLDPFFKPDWSPETLMSIMYTSHVSCVRRDLLMQVGLLRRDFNGSQDWDLILRVTEQSTRITHIPKVLYHWRMLPGSAAAEVDAKPYAIESGKRAREDALKRRGLKGSLRRVDELPTCYRTVYAVQGSPKVSIIIPSKNNVSVLKPCVTSIRELTRYRNFELLIVDNGSDDAASLGYLDELQRLEKTRVSRDSAPFNWSAINNKAAQDTSGDILLFLNDDTEVITPRWLEEMIGYAQLSHIGAVGAKLLYPGGNMIQHQGVVNLAVGPSHALTQSASNAPVARNYVEFNYIGVTGACLMMARQKFEQLGGFDERLAIAYNDVDLCFRAVKQGWYNVVCQGAELVHHESLSRGNDRLDVDKFERLIFERKRLYQMHPEFFLFDPFHNPNLHPNDVLYGVTQ